MEWKFIILVPVMEIAMDAKMHVVLEGLPERIQEAADLLDLAFPGSISWRLAKLGRDHTIRLEGVAVACGDLLHPPTWTVSLENSGTIWKLSSLKTRENQQDKRFCASLSRSLRS